MTGSCCSGCGRSLDRKDIHIGVFYGPCDLNYGPPLFLQSALRRLPGVVVDLFECRGDPYKFGKTDLNVYVDWAEDMGPYKDFPMQSPSVYWVSDSHVSEESWKYRRDKAAKADYVLHAIWYECPGVEQGKGGEGGRFPSARWFPYAAEHTLWRPRPDIKKIYDVGFVGHFASHLERLLLLQAFLDEFGADRVLVRDGIFLNDAVAASAQCRVLINTAQTRSTNMRTFEALSMGGCLLQPLTPDLWATGFRDGEHGLYYETVEDALRLAHVLLESEHNRSEMGIAGRRLILKAHTYVHRAVEIARMAGWKGDEADINTALAAMPAGYQ